MLKFWYLDNMSRELNSRMVEDISRRLAELLALPMSRVKVKLEPFVPGDENNRAVASAHCMAGLNSARW